ncbi:hypothetical protein O3G_MSEX001504 [Manduca sexta]|uniref:Uncharacterized protein n=1 Tax=Manduca sexta TaxID=7130 RepID=A0A921YK71_MANSE|nr:hypothetical protein O3G_MSEX001504 [Manduca sexta]
MSGGQKAKGTQKEENDEENKLTIGFVGRPQVFIEEPRRPPVPVLVNQFNREPTTVQVFHKQTPWGAKNTCLPIKQKRRCNIFRWCRRRRGYKAETVNEVVRVGRQRRRIVREVELRQRSESAPPVVIKEKRHMLKKSASVKPITKTQYATVVKKYKHKAPLADRFVNCIYRVCCQFYCYLTCVIVVIVVVVFVL